MNHNHSHANVSNLKIAFFLNLAFTLLEIVGGILTNSVAILSDSVHDLGDSLSLGLAWYLDRYAQKQGDQRYSYGYRRFSLLGALLNTLVLIAGSIFVLSEAIPRIMMPEPSYAPGMVLIAILGVVANGAAVLRVRDGRTLNAQVVAWHLLEDVLGWLAVLVVSLVLLITEFYLLDPILSILITIYVMYNVVRNLRKTLSLFMQAVPDHLDLAEIDERLMAIDCVLSTHHTHVWSMDGEQHVMTTHLVVGEQVTRKDVLGIKEAVYELSRELGFAHTTIEIEYGDEPCHMNESN